MTETTYKNNEGGQGKTACPHQITFTRADLFKANPMFSKKTCELCGETIVLDNKHKLRIVAFIFLVVVLFVFGSPPLLENVLPEISFMAKGLVLALVFVGIYAGGLLLLMRNATYHTYVKPEHLDNVAANAYRKAQEKSKAKTEKFFGR
jgi:hypothetical protein